MTTTERSPTLAGEACRDEHQPGCDCVFPEQKDAPAPAFLQRMAAHPGATASDNLARYGCAADVNHEPVASPYSILRERLQAASDAELTGPDGEWASGAYPSPYDEAIDAISALEALVVPGPQAEGEAVAWRVRYIPHGEENIAWGLHNKSPERWLDDSYREDYEVQPLYAHPAPVEPVELREKVAVIIRRMVAEGNARPLKVRSEEAADTILAALRTGGSNG